MEYETYVTAEMHPRLTSPTCEDLGIPRDITSDCDPVDILSSRGRLDPLTLHSYGYTSDGVKYDRENPNSPFSTHCQIPLPPPFGGYDYGFEPAFIRKRNERERERVRCVNEGYARLREHLPLENKEKRISKVETLRTAIRYIKHLQGMLSENKSYKSSVRDQDSENSNREEGPKAKRRALHTKEDNNNNNKE